MSEEEFYQQTINALRLLTEGQRALLIEWLAEEYASELEGTYLPPGELETLLQRQAAELLSGPWPAIDITDFIPQDRTTRKHLFWQLWARMGAADQEAFLTRVLSEIERNRSRAA